LSVRSGHEWEAFVIEGFKRANATLTSAEELALKTAGLSTFLVMVIVSADVFMRYGLNSPFSWSYDLIGMYLVPLSFFFALSATFRRNHHVAVDLFYLRAGEPLRRLARLLVAIMILPFIGWIIVLSGVDARDRLVNGDVVAGTLLWPTWIPSFMVAAGFVLLTLRLVLDAVALLAAITRGAREVHGESPARREARVDVEDAL
jgi:TRAP-type C4-dicarboxylate transport system permease small subunit